jgi:mRNA interferase MazF
VQRGQVRWAAIPAPIGRRPVVLLSRNAAYQARTSVTVAAVTRTIRRLAVEVLLDETDGLPARCVVNLDDILTVPKTYLEDYITSLSPQKMSRVNRAVTFALDLNSVT